MDPNTIAQIISNIGFPIACVIVMFWLWDRERQAHKEESDKWIEAIHNNTIVMEKILERIGEE